MFLKFKSSTRFILILNLEYATLKFNILTITVHKRLASQFRELYINHVKNLQINPSMFVLKFIEKRRMN